MNRTLLTKLVACVLVGSLTLTLPVTAQNNTAAAAPHASHSPTEKKPKRKVYKGTIDAIDTAAGMLTVKKATTSKTFKVADDAKFATSDNRNSSLAPLKEGDLVNVRFTEEGDMAIAHHIGHARKKAKSAPKSE
jgi:Cu/Ag efflux protein CusF